LAPVFEGFDTSAYQPRYEIINVHGNLAYVLASFDEALRPRDGQPGIRIHGRSVQFWRREEEAWRIVMLLTARSAPEEYEG
jgi:ketosteroid isomerase-like protein